MLVLLFVSVGPSQHTRHTLSPHPQDVSYAMRRFTLRFRRQSYENFPTLQNFFALNFNYFAMPTQTPT